MDIEKIKELLKGESGYRLKQIKKAVFGDLIQSWDEATILPKNLRQRLKENFPSIQSLKPEIISESKDGQTVKILFNLEDGLKIESVLMKHNDGPPATPYQPAADTAFLAGLPASLRKALQAGVGMRAGRRTVCVSSQVGCQVGCKFCATGQLGFKRNLTASEITDQILFFAKYLKKSNEKVTNFVFMGMGEPFLNYDNVLSAIRTLNDKEGLNLGARNISISTSGIIEGMKKLAKENLQVNLAISLHAPNNKLRSEIMPINKSYPIEKVLAAVDDYIKETNRKVMFEYLLIDGLNDSLKEAKELAHIMKKPLYHVNLISFNPVDHSDFKPSSDQKTKEFKKILEKSGISVTQRYRFGQDIAAACGQLSAKKL